MRCDRYKKRKIAPVLKWLDEKFDRLMDIFAKPIIWFDELENRRKK